MRIPNFSALAVVTVLFAVGKNLFAQTPLSSPAPSASSWTLWIAPGSVSALIALISLIYAYRKDKKADASKKTAEVEKARADALETRLFYKAKAITWTIEITDLDGNLRIQCAFEDIQTLPKGSTLNGFPGSLGFAPPEAAITQYPTKKYHSFLPATLNREVTLTVFEPRKPNAYEYICNITGGLPYGHCLSFTYEAAAAKGVFMSKEEVEQNVLGSFKKEYWAHYVTTPADLLEISLSFPENYGIERFYLGVCIGKIATDAQMYGEEIRRIEAAQGFEVSANRARLRVDKPFVGMTYLIYWNPPPKRVVDALR